MVRVELTRVLVRETEDSHIVELREHDGARSFPIVIGLHEAAAIQRRLLNETPPRPQTHDLLSSIVTGFGAGIDKVIISELRHDEMGRGTFYARIHLDHDGQIIDIDSRPSDALALVAGTNVPIYVEEQVFEEIWESD
jgi:bifunctional DNase/RNase